MKKNTQLAVTLLSLLCAGSPAFAGGVEMSPPTNWDFYIGGSGVVYGYEYRFNSVVYGVQPLITPPGANSRVVSPALTKFRSTAALGGFDVGVGVWADRGYFGIEGRYDIGRIPASNMAGLISGTPTPISELYSAYMRNNASVVAKIGYQLWPRTMSYMILGWIRTTAQLSVRMFGQPNNQVNTTGAIEFFAGQVYKHSWNGGTIGFGISHLLVDGLSAFAEFAIAGYHIPIELRAASATVTGGPLFVVGSTTILNLNYYHYNLRLGLNWSFASLI